MRILHIVPSYLPATRYGGPIYSVHGLCKALVALGHEVHVLTTSVNGSGDSDVPLAEAVNLDGVKIWYFPCPDYGRRLYYAPLMKRHLQRYLDEFDVLHLHSVFLWPTWAAARVACEKKVPYLIAPRGMLVPELIQRKSRYLKGLWIRCIEKKNLQFAAGIHVTTVSEGEAFRDMRLAATKLYCVPNGIDWPADEAVPGQDVSNVLPDKPYVLFLSRINWKKGLDRLIRAWRWVDDVPLLIAGNDEEGYQPDLEALARREGVNERITFIGPVGGDDKWALYRNAELFVLPSYSENFGNVVLEAMAMACPVLVTPEVGLASMVREKGVGRVVEGKPEHLAEAVNAMISDKAQRQSMGHAGQRVVREEYSWPGVARRMLQVYQEIREELT